MPNRNRGRQHVHGPSQHLGGCLGRFGVAAVSALLLLTATPAPAGPPGARGRTMVTLGGTVPIGLQTSVSLRIHGITAAADMLLPRVPEDKKLVLTDFLVTHNITGASNVLGANFRFSSTTCDEGARTIFQLRVGPGAGTNVNLTTGFEVPPGQEICFATGGSSATPNLGLSFTMLGYLTDANPKSPRPDDVGGE